MEFSGLVKKWGSDTFVWDGKEYVKLLPQKETYTPISYDPNKVVVQQNLVFPANPVWNVSFHTRDNEEIMVLNENGDIEINGKLIGSDKKVIDFLRKFCFSYSGDRTFLEDYK